MTKVKGFGYYNNSVMDVADYVYPPQVRDLKIMFLKPGKTWPQQVTLGGGEGGALCFTFFTQRQTLTVSDGTLLDITSQNRGKFLSGLWVPERWRQ